MDSYNIATITELKKKLWGIEVWLCWQSLPIFIKKHIATGDSAFGYKSEIAQTICKNCKIAQNTE